MRHRRRTCYPETNNSRTVPVTLARLIRNENRSFSGTLYIDSLRFSSLSERYRTKKKNEYIYICSRKCPEFQILLTRISSFVFPRRFFRNDNNNNDTYRRTYYVIRFRTILQNDSFFETIRIHRERNNFKFDYVGTLFFRPSKSFAFVRFCL